MSFPPRSWRGTRQAGGLDDQQRGRRRHHDGDCAGARHLLGGRQVRGGWRQRHGAQKGDGGRGAGGGVDAQGYGQDDRLAGRDRPGGSRGSNIRLRGSNVGPRSPCMDQQDCAGAYARDCAFRGTQSVERLVLGDRTGRVVSLSGHG